VLTLGLPDEELCDRQGLRLDALTNLAGVTSLSMYESFLESATP
jgi:hypothetical protein